IGGVLEGSPGVDRSLAPLVHALGESVETDLRHAYDVQRHVVLNQLAKGASLEQAQAAVQLTDRLYPQWTSLSLRRLDGIVRERLPGGTDVLEYYQPALQRAADPRIASRLGWTIVTTETSPPTIRTPTVPKVCRRSGGIALPAVMDWSVGHGTIRAGSHYRNSE